MASGEPIRVLVVDDSAVVRSVLKKGLGGAQGLEVVGAAHNGRQGLEMVEAEKPDAVVLDVEMPEMTGIQFLDHLQPDKRSDLVVVMFSSASKKNAEVTMECLSRGAQEFVNKPDPARTGMREPLEETVNELARTVRGLVRAKKGKRGEEPARGAAPAAAPEKPAAPIREGGGVPSGFQPDLVVIGSSTGGPQTLHTIWSAVDAVGPPRVPVLLVQHMAQGFTGPFADRLGARGPFPWREAEDGEKVPVGTGLVAPGNYHMRLSRYTNRLTVHLDQEPRVNSCRPAVDPLFMSASELPGTRVLGIVLTGMGQDGLEGARHVRSGGGVVVVQSEESSAVWGMPGSVARAGLHNAVMEPRGISDLLSRVLYAAAASG
ncbi:chemotaxis-specific protein-glutamate methyltransferase CheB [Thiohalorhabdus methylotrophus]|uniref:Protein-glutamate methylesterase/protein-glutamine glutaminase n=1 Tax=Thiohalorhabdus methylotrophus TaxID=3242694 RepID=A0ABV4TZ75_9GAMM